MQDTNCQVLLRYTPTPIQEIHDTLFDKASVQILIKREDLNHPYVSGNKWWKLKYNLEEAKRQNKKILLTFGGAYSNHIYATAAAAQELNFESIGIIRGEETLPLNSTLQFAKEQGMLIHYVSRDAYRKKSEPEFIQHLRNQFGDFYLIPEGGTNELAAKGAEEFAQTLGTDFDYVCCAVGTGGTMAGLIRGIDREKEILGFSVLKGGEFLKNEIGKFLHEPYENWLINTSYHHGGYAKTTEPLLTFMKDFTAKNGIQLDPVYTGKLLWGVMEEIKSGRFKKGSRVLILHSGGLQGNN